MENIESQIQNSDRPVLVDFYATWCGPCKALSPIIDELKNEYQDRLDVLKVDIDENFQLAQKYSIQSIPTLIVFKNGVPFKTMKGFLPKNKINEMLNSAI